MTKGLEPLNALMIIATAAAVSGWVAGDLVFTGGAILFQWNQTGPWPLEPGNPLHLGRLMIQAAAMLGAISITIGIIAVAGAYTRLKISMFHQGSRLTAMTLQANAAGAAFGVTLERAFETAGQGVMVPVLLTGAALAALEIIVLRSVDRHTPDER